MKTRLWIPCLALAAAACGSGSASVGNLRVDGSYADPAVLRDARTAA